MLRKGILVGGVALIAATLPAAADTTGVDSTYVRIEAGHVFDWDSEAESGTPVGTADVDGSWVAGGAIGFYPLPNWRVELEGSHSKADVAGAAAGDIKTQTAMVNVIREFAVNDRFRPFVGGGIGAARINPDYAIGATTDSESYKLAFQGTAGLAVAVTDRLTADLRYRFLKAMDYDFGGSERDYKNHAVLAGLRYQLSPNKRRAAAPQETYQEVVEEPVAPVVQDEKPADLVQLVFFPFDDSKLTPEAGAVVNEVADIATSTGFVMIEAEGHADRAGPNGYNDRLSRRRAESVRDAMIARGVPADRIRIIAKGEREPRVPTADGVRSPANRFVKITVMF